MIRCLLTNLKEHLARGRARERVEIEEKRARATRTAAAKKMAVIHTARANLTLKVVQARTGAVVPSSVAPLFDQSTIKGQRRIEAV